MGFELEWSIIFLSFDFIVRMVVFRGVYVLRGFCSDNMRY